MNYFNQLIHADQPDFIDEFTRVLRGSRVVYFSGVPADIEFKAYYRKLALAAGKFVKRDEDYRTGDQAAAQDDWMDIRFVDDLKRDSFRHSDTRQPIHTDGAYLSYHFDISFFFCTVQAEVGGATTFIDGVEVIRLLRRYERNCCVI
ncbi:TauD/TfdA family dioxygenase [bacterium]|nr:TauD/TfdA family dioxygenase [bacterium]